MNTDTENNVVTIDEVTLGAMTLCAEYDKLMERIAKYGKANGGHYGKRVEKIRTMVTEGMVNGLRKREGSLEEPEEVEPPKTAKEIILQLLEPPSSMVSMRFTPKEGERLIMAIRSRATAWDPEQNVKSGGTGQQMEGEGS